MNIEQEIQNILDRNFTRGDNANALKELLVLYNVSNSTCDKIFTQATKSDWDEPVIKHFRDDNEDSKYNDWDSPPIGGFSDW